MAAKQYRSMGFPLKRIFPFGYFRSWPSDGVTQREDTTRGRLVFLGLDHLIDDSPGSLCNYSDMDKRDARLPGL